MTHPTRTWLVRFMPHGGYTIFNEHGHVVQRLLDAEHAASCHAYALRALRMCDRPPEHYGVRFEYAEEINDAPNEVTDSVGGTVRKEPVELAQH